MPRGDKTGPMGMGPMTGRAAGDCAGNQDADNASTPGGQGRGLGGGGRGRRGRCRRNQFYSTGQTGQQRAAADVPAATPEPETGEPVGAGEEELDRLKQQAAALADSLDEIKKRIAALQPESREEEAGSGN